MNIRQYLIDTFHFNDRMNKKMVEKIRMLPEQKECIRHFSHLINSQNKWMARILHNPGTAQMSWWEPVYPLDQLEIKWDQSLGTWINFLQNKTEEELMSEIEFTGFDGARWAAKLFDIALQLNYHSIHHRAQMQMNIRAQGIEPDFIDYIGTRYRKLA